MPSIDFAEIKRRVTVKELLECYNWKASERHGDQLRGPCPIHKSARPVSRSFAVRGCTWFCHSCKRGGVGSIDLFMAITGERDVAQAAASLCFLLAINVPVRTTLEQARRNRKRNK